jgi:predicted nucleic acid-binding protein
MGQLKIENLPRGRVLALDTVTLVYFLERHPTFFPIVRDLFKNIEKNRFSAIMSSLVFTELLVPAFKAGKSEEAMRLQRVLINFPNLETIPVSTAVATEAARLRADHGIRTPDAIHLATAIDNGAAGFITNDKKLQRLQDELPIWLIGG